jgi:hypothetical protein
LVRVKVNVLVLRSFQVFIMNRSKHFLLDCSLLTSISVHMLMHLDNDALFLMHVSNEVELGKTFSECTLL